MVSNIDEPLDILYLWRQDQKLNIQDRRNRRFTSGSGIDYFKSMDLKLINLKLVISGYRNGEFIPRTSGVFLNKVVLAFLISQSC